MTDIQSKFLNIVLKTQIQSQMAEFSVYYVIKKGDLWIGTSTGGVDRYNISGGNIYHSTHNSQDSTSISDNRITAIYEDSKNNIWVGTQHGLNFYNSTTKKFKGSS